MVKVMLKVIKVRTIKGYRSKFTIVVDERKVAKVMSVNHKFKCTVGTKFPHHMVETLKIAREQIKDLFKQTKEV